MKSLTPTLEVYYKLHLNKRTRIAKGMSWTCHGRNNGEMVEKLFASKLLKTPEIVTAMKTVDRGLFCVDPRSAYQDAPQPIGFNVTISAPHMHALSLELLADKLKPGAQVLDVGSGSGYLCAVCAVLVGPEGRILGVDHIQELVERSLEAVARVPQCRPMLISGALRIVQGDGREGHAESAAPRGWDAIHVGAAAAKLPQALVDQLAPGGRLVCPVGPEGGTQDLVVVDRLEDGRIRKEVPMRVQFVPLTSAENQLGRFNRL